MIDVRISDSEGHRTRVTPQGDLVTVLSPNPPLGSEILTIPFIDFLTIDGIEGGTSDLDVDGSTTSIEASILARTNGDVYLTTLSALISDNTIALNRFGGIAGGLINGLEFFYESPLGRFSSPLDIRTNYDFIRLATLTSPIGSKTDAYQVSNAGVDSEDAYTPIIDLTRYNAQNYGIRLRKGTKDKIGFQIRDDLTPLSVFNILAIGYTRIIDEDRQD